MSQLYTYLFKLNKSRNNLNFYKKNTIKNFPSSVREWNSSIYTFNKNYLSIIPNVNKLTMKLIKSYFNLYNFRLEKKIRKFRIWKRFRRLSSNKIYISNGVFKHTNNNVIITLYVYNRQKINYIYFLKKKFNKFLTNRLITKLLFIKLKLQNYQKIIEKNKLIIIDILRLESNKSFINYSNFINEKLYEKMYKILLKKIFRKYRKYFFYKQLLYINNCKFNYNYLTYLSYILRKLFNKNIQFDIINLNSFYLNSDIFTESILLKIRKNRRKLIRKLKKLLLSTNISLMKNIITSKALKKNTIDFKEDLDPINYLILKNAYKNKKSIKRTVLSLIKYKRITGMRLEAKGRLTKRYTASRSLSKLRYKGNLINIDSSYLGISSIFLKGNLRSNIQYTKLNSKTRIGSFGLKGWISGY